MAAMRNHVDLPPFHYQCYKVDKFKNCANCTHLEYQLRATNDELNSAKAIIALLREDLTNMNTMRTVGQQLTHDPRGRRHNITCEYDPKGENRTTITQSKDKYQKKGKQTEVEKKTHKNYTPYNRFEPLANPEVGQPTNVTAQYTTGKQHQTRNTMRTTTNPTTRRKIPSIVNGSVNRSKNKKKS